MAAATLTIKVNDAQVKTAEASLHRLRAAAAKTDYGIRQTRSDMAGNEEERQRRLAGFMGKDLPQAGNIATKAIEAVSEATSGATGRFGAMAAGIGGVALGVAGFVVVAVALAAVLAALYKQVVDLTKSYADWAVGLGNVAEANGLAVDTVAALTAEAEAQGRSWKDLEGPVGNYRKLIGQASAGSVEARATLKLLGVDGTRAMYDIDGAFKQAVTSIMKAPPGLQQARLAMAAFGDDGAKLLPFFRAFNGDIDKAIAKAQEMGYSLSGQQVAQAREFTRAYEDVRNAIRGIGLTFIREFLPSVLKSLRDFGQWLVDNKTQIKEWAEWGGGWVKWFIEKLSLLAEKIAQIKRDGDEMARMEAYNRGDPIPLRPLAAPLPQNWGITSSVPDLTQGPDPAALAAAREMANKLREERERAAKAELSALIQLYDGSATRIGKAYDDAFQSITDKFKETLNVQQYEADWQKLKQWYGDQVSDLLPQWKQLVEQRISTEKMGTNAAEVARRDLVDKTQALNQKTVDHEATAAKTIKDIRTKLSQDAIKALEAEMQRREELGAANTKTRVAEIEREVQLGFMSEKKGIEVRNALELGDLQARKSALERHLASVKGNGQAEIETRQQIGLVSEAIAQQQITNANRVTDAETKKKDAVNKLREAYEQYRDSLSDELTVLQRGGKELSTYEKVLRDMERSYKALDPTQKENLLNLAAEIDAIKELNRQHAELKEFFKDSLRYVFEGNFEGLMQSWGDRIKDKLADTLGDIFATSVLGFNPNETKNPVARPIVDKLDETNKILRSIAVGGGTGAAAGAGAGGGSIWSRILGAFGLGGGSGQGPGGTPMLNPSGGGADWRRYLGAGTFGGDYQSGIGLGQGSGRNGGGGGIWSQLSQIFSTGPGGIFAPQKNILTGKMSGLGGIMGGIGSLATVVGGFLPGRLGSVVSMAGTGMSIGAMFGPWGAAIGAGIGALIGLFTGGGQRRADERTRNQAMLDAQSSIRTQFDKLIEDVRFGRTDPTTAVSQGTSIGQGIRDQYVQAMSQLKDKKTRNIALADVSRIDALIASKMSELKQVSEVATASADRMKRILPEFAGGVFISQGFRNFQRMNGLLSGSWTGHDYRAALLADAEMVLNPMQQNRVRSLAGFDVFAGAGIPNYPNATPAAAMAGGGIAGALGTSQVVVQPIIYVEGVTFETNAKAWLESDDGSRVLVDVVKKEKTTGRIK